MNNVKFLKCLILQAVRQGYKNLALYNIYYKIDEDYITTRAYYQIVFDRDFARAIWGDKDYYRGRVKEYSLPYWKYKLRKLISVDDPIEYLKEDTCLKRLAI